MRVESYSVEPVRLFPAGLPGDDESAQQAGRRVVRVPLHPGRDLQQRVALERPGRGRRAPRPRPHRRRRRPPSCPARARAGSRCGSAGAGRAARHRTTSKARRIARTTRCARRRAPGRRPAPSTSTVTPVGRDGDLDVVVQAQREPEGVEPGPEVGRRGRDPHPDLGGPAHDVPASPQLQRVGHRTRVDRHHRRRRRGEQRGVGVLQPVPRHRAHHQRPARQRRRPPRTAAARPRSPPTPARRTPPRAPTAAGTRRGSRRR